MASVWIPVPLRDLTDGKESVNAPGPTVGEVIGALEGLYPGVRDRLCEGSRLRPTIMVQVDGRVARLGLLERVEPDSTITFHPMVEGG